MSRRDAAAGMTLLIVLVLAIAAASSHPLDRLRTLSTLRKVDPHPLYRMRYYGDYGFHRLVQQELPAGLAGAPIPDGGPAWACTCFIAFGDCGGPIFGRNFD